MSSLVSMNGEKYHIYSQVYILLMESVDVYFNNK